MNSLLNILRHRYTQPVLFLINVFVGIVIFRISSQLLFGDEKGYWSMGQSILNGKFSGWYFLPKYYPETLRTPGYPIFIALCQLISDSTMFVKIIQLVCYFVCVWLCLKIIRKIKPDVVYQNLFLLLLIPNVQVVYYSGYISAEILSVLFLCLAVYLIFSDKTIINSVLLAVCCYLCFFMRPSFLLFPILIFLFMFFKENRRYALTFISIYVLLLIPFGLWNKKEHGVFKVTPIEGGGGVYHLGYWAFKLPNNYIEPYYFGNTIITDELFPIKYTEEQRLEFKKQYDKECTALFGSLNQYLSSEDSSYVAYMKANKAEIGISLVYPSEYSLKREELLWKATTEDILNDKVYYFQTRLFSLMRFYVTGVTTREWEKATSLPSKIKVLYPALVTFTFIFCGLLFVTFRLLFKEKQMKYRLLLLCLLWYYGIVHIPFTIQSRYTIPAHLFILAALSLVLIRSDKSKYSIQQN